MKALVTQLCSTLYNPLNCNPPGFSVHGILQKRILDWVATPFSRGSSPPRDQTRISYVWFVLLYGGNQCDFSVTQSCLTLCGPVDCSLLGSTVPGIFPRRNARTDCYFLFQRIFPTQELNLHLPCLLHWQMDSLLLSHL